MVHSVQLLSLSQLQASGGGSSKLGVLHGFSPTNRVAVALRDQLLDNLQPLNVTLVSAGLQELAVPALSSSAFTVLYLSGHDTASEESALAKMQTCLDAHLLRRACSRLAIVCEGRGADALQALAQRAVGVLTTRGKGCVEVRCFSGRRVLEEVLAFVCGIPRPSPLGLHGEEVAGPTEGVAGEVAGWMADFHACVAQRDLATLSWNTTKEVLDEAVARAHSLHPSISASPLGRQLLGVHLGCHLACLYDQQLRRYRGSALRGFKGVLRELTVSELLARDLRRLSASTLRQFEEVLRALRGDLQHLLGSTPLVVQDAWAVQQLAAELSEIVQRHLAQHTLGGAYNPFLRLHPFPLLRFSAHYLITSAGSGVPSRLYDVRTTGVQERRADPLYVRGLARMPFDPADRPQLPGTPRRSLMQVIRNLFTFPE